jgi:HK97 family phage major capsid protein
MNIKELLAKKADELNDEEKAFLKAHASELSAEEKTKFGIDDEDEGMDVDALKKLVNKQVEDALLGKRIDAISNELVSKFQAGVEEARAKAIDNKGKEVDHSKNNNTTRDFLKAILADDKARAKAITTETGGTAPDDSNAGVLIPVELRAEILRIAETQYGLARRDMWYLPFSGPGNSRPIPVLGTSVSVYWTLEKGKKTSTQPKFTTVTQTLKKLAAIVPFTDEVLEDSAINLTALVAELIAEAIVKEEDLQFFAGTGVPWTGLLNNGSLLSVTLAAGAASMDADDLLDMIDAIPTSALTGAKFYMNRTALSVIRKLRENGTTGAYIYQNPGQGLPATIWNYPVEISDAFPAVGDVLAGEAFVLFGNLKKTCVFGDKQQIRIKMLDQATITDTDDESDNNGDLNLAEQDMTALRFVERVGYVCGLPGSLVKLIAGQES